MKKRNNLILLSGFTILFSLRVSAQSKLASKFNLKTMRLKGTPQEQALYLLRNVKQCANLGQALTKLPAFINSLMNNKVNLISDAMMTRKISPSSNSTGCSVSYMHN